MCHRKRKKMRYFIISAILLLSCPSYTVSKDIIRSLNTIGKYPDESLDNNIIDFDEEYAVKYNKTFGIAPWHSNEYFNKESHTYTVDKDYDKKIYNKLNNDKNESKYLDSKLNEKIEKVENETEIKREATSTIDYSVIPLELLSTTDNTPVSLHQTIADNTPVNLLEIKTEITPVSLLETTTENTPVIPLESTTELDLTIIPLSTTRKFTKIEMEQTVTQPSTTQQMDTTTDAFTDFTESTTYLVQENDTSTTEVYITEKYTRITETTTIEDMTTIENRFETSTLINNDKTTFSPNLNTTSINNVSRIDLSTEIDDSDVPIFTELDTEDQVEVPEDYYDSKDIIPTTPPKTDALSMLFGLAGSMVESVVGSVAERVVPKGIVDLFRRMQRQNEMLEAEKLRSREENGGIGQFGRGILKTISSGISKPLSQLMAGVRDIGSLDNDHGFVSGLASGVVSGVSSVANVANSVVEQFKDRVQAIYPGTVWCGDGRSAAARSSDLGLFFFTDTCCRQHDACKIYIKAGETKYGLTNTGLFTRSHCSCDAKFRDCLRKTNSLVSAQIGLTYFNVLGPQCFRKAHPIIKCMRRTSMITGQKCEEYELDYSKPRMWQWFDNETF